MPWSLKNVALDPAYAMQRRVAPKLDMEPVLAGGRIRLRQQVTISDEEYAGNTERIARHVGNGVLTCTPVGDVFPTIEVYVAAGYFPENYPPQGCEEVPSAALTHYKETGFMTAEEAEAAAKAEAEEKPEAVATEAEEKAATDEAVEAEAASTETSPVEAPVVEATGAGWYVLRLEGEEIDKVRGKEALRNWFTSNGYAIPQQFEESASAKDSQ